MKKKMLLCLLIILLIGCRYDRSLLPIEMSKGFLSIDNGVKYYKFDLEDFINLHSKVYPIYEGTIDGYHLFVIYRKTVKDGETSHFALRKEQCIIESECTPAEEYINIRKLGFRKGYLLYGKLFVKNSINKIYGKIAVPIKKSSGYIEYHSIKYYKFTISDLLNVNENFRPTYIGTIDQYHLFRTFNGDSNESKNTSFIALVKKDCVIENERTPENEKLYMFATNKLREATLKKGKFKVEN